MANLTGMLDYRCGCVWHWGVHPATVAACEGLEEERLRHGAVVAVEMQIKEGGSVGWGGLKRIHIGGGLTH